MAVDDIYQIRVKQVMAGGEEMLNVFYYQVISGNSSADDLNSVFADDLWDLVRAMQTPSTVTTQYQCINGRDNSDYEEQNASDAGLSANTFVAARFAALGFRSPRTQPGIRYSYKRFGGVPVQAFGTTDGSWDNTIYTTIIPIQNILGATLEGDDAAYDPVQITGGFELGVNPTKKTTLKGQWQFNIYPSSQVSRKISDWQVLTT